MVNSEDFKKRLEKLFGHYGLTPAAFADKVNVQRSSISHLLSGRNRPSLEFVLKVIKTFPDIDLYWLLNGKGTFPSSNDTSTTRAHSGSREMENNEILKNPRARTIEKIIVFYSDGSFKAYRDEANFK